MKPDRSIRVGRGGPITPRVGVRIETGYWLGDGDNDSNHPPRGGAD